MADIQLSLNDKRRGGGPRVGPFQERIPGNGWEALPKYDFTTKNRSSAFNERMHVEWENHADHILKNGGELPTASVVAKAGFRSCAPCCRDMLALARPTGKTFIMVDLAEQDGRGTFHFVMGHKYLPVPKEACTREEVLALKKIVLDAQSDRFASSELIYDAVTTLRVPIDEVAQAFYLGDPALLPVGCAADLRGEALLAVLHAEHFARLAAEYGASILRDERSPKEKQDAILLCRDRAKLMLLAAWRHHLRNVEVDLEAYAKAAVAPLLPDDPSMYRRRSSASAMLASMACNGAPSRRAERRWRRDGPKGVGRASEPLARLTADKLQAIDEDEEVAEGASTAATPSTLYKIRKWKDDDGAASSAAASTALPAGDQVEGFSDLEDPEEEEEEEEGAS